jgi:hypothetical protein
MAFTTMPVATALLGLSGAIASAFHGTPPRHLTDSPPPSCVTFSTVARFAGLAYNHIVHIANGCNVAQSCTVTTDVNPEPQVATVPPRSTVAVVTFIGSPARTFIASVRCSP